MSRIVIEIDALDDTSIERAYDCVAALYEAVVGSRGGSPRVGDVFPSVDGGSVSMASDDCSVSVPLAEETLIGKKVTVRDSDDGKVDVNSAKANAAIEAKWQAEQEKEKQRPPSVGGGVPHGLTAEQFSAIRAIIGGGGPGARRPITRSGDPVVQQAAREFADPQYSQIGFF